MRVATAELRGPRSPAASVMQSCDQSGGAGFSPALSRRSGPSAASTRIIDEAGRGHRAWHGHAAGLRRRGDMAPADRRAIRRAQVAGFRRLRHRLPDRRARCRAATRRTRSIPTSGWTPKSSAGSMISSSLRCARRRRRLRDAEWAPATYEEEDRDRRSHRLGHRRPRRHLRRLDHAAREGAAPHFAVLHSRPPDQSGRRLRLDRA